MQVTPIPQAGRSKHYAPLILYLILSQFLTSLPFAPMFMGMMALVLGPALLVCAHRLHGTWVSLIFIGYNVLMSLFTANVVAAGLCLVYLMPLWLLMVLLKARPIPFQHACFAGILVQITATTAVFLAAQWFFHGQLMAVLLERTLAAINAMPFRDTFLYSLTQNGVLSLDALPLDAPIYLEQTNALTFTDSARSALFTQIGQRFQFFFQAFYPNLFTQNALVLLPLSLALTNHILRQQTNVKSDVWIQLPPFSNWHVPHKHNKVLIALAISYPLILISRGSLQFAFQLVFSVFYCMMLLQGFSALSALSRKLIRSDVLRIVVCGLVFFLSPQLLFYLGIVDQVIDMRFLRHTPNQNHWRLL